MDQIPIGQLRGIRQGISVIRSRQRGEDVPAEAFTHQLGCFSSTLITAPIPSAMR